MNVKTKQRKSSRRKKTERLTKIIQAAKKHFATSGFDGASTRQIADDAGVAQSLLLYYFETKEDLWKAVMDDCFERARAEVLPRPEDRSTDEREQVSRFISGFVDFCAKDADLHRLMTLTGRSKNSRYKWLVETHLRDGFDYFTPLLKKGQKEGWIRKGDVTLLYYSVIAIAGTTYSLASEIELLAPKSKALETKAVKSTIASLLFVD